jgi:glycogen synthase
MFGGKRTIILFGPWPPPYGGVASHVQDLAWHLKKRELPTRLLCYGEFRETRTLRKITVVRPGWWKTRLKLALALSSRVILHDHSGMIPNPDAGLLQSLHSIIRRRQARWILTLHDETLLTRFPAWPREARELCSKFLRAPDHVICVGTRLQAFLGEFGIPDSKLSNIPPVLPPIETPAICLPTDLQAFLADHKPVLTTIGAFHPNYDLASVARAFPMIRADHPSAGLIVIDPGFARDEGIRAGVIQALEEGAAGCYRITSQIPREHVSRILKASAAFIRGARQESFGLSRVEAILLGIPVVTTQAGETRYMRLYEYGNPEHLAREVLTVLGNPQDLSAAQQYYRGIGGQALDRILAIYDSSTSH